MITEPVRLHVLEGRLTAGHARAILTADDPSGLADVIIAKGLSVRDAEGLARTTPSASRPSAAPKRKPSKDTDTQALESDLSDVLGLGVEVVDRGGVGELRIRYATLEQLDELCRKLTSRG